MFNSVSGALPDYDPALPPFVSPKIALLCKHYELRAMLSCSHHVARHELGSRRRNPEVCRP